MSSCAMRVLSLLLSLTIALATDECHDTDCAFSALQRRAKRGTGGVFPWCLVSRFGWTWVKFPHQGWSFTLQSHLFVGQCDYQDEMIHHSLLQESVVDWYPASTTRDLLEASRLPPEFSEGFLSDSSDSLIFNPPFLGELHPMNMN